MASTLFAPCPTYTSHTPSSQSKIRVFSDPAGYVSAANYVDADGRFQADDIISVSCLDLLARSASICVSCRGLSWRQL